MYTIIVNPLHGDQVIRQYEFFSQAFADVDDLILAFFADDNLKSVEMRYNNEKI